MPVILPWVKEWEPIELLWLAGPRRDSRGHWMITAVTGGVTSGETKRWPLSLGLLPVLIPGRCYQYGEVLMTRQRGNVGTVIIPNLATGEEIGANALPEMHSFSGSNWGYGQKFFRYELSDGDYIIPSIEIVRFLFAHNKTMANAMLRPAGLICLYQPMNPGFYDDLHLQFTFLMPRVCLSKAFVREFSWAAVSPVGRRSWDSVLSRTTETGPISLTLPELLNTHLTFRGVRKESATLVLEILGLFVHHGFCKFGTP